MKSLRRHLRPDQTLINAGADITVLPREVLLRILKLCSAEERMEARQVCRNFYSAFSLSPVYSVRSFFSRVFDGESIDSLIELEYTTPDIIHRVKSHFYSPPMQSLRQKHSNPLKFSRQVLLDFLLQELNPDRIMELDYDILVQELTLHFKDFQWFRDTRIESFSHLPLNIIKFLTPSHTLLDRLKLSLHFSNLPVAKLTLELLLATSDCKFSIVAHTLRKHPKQAFALALFPPTLANKKSFARYHDSIHTCNFGYTLQNLVSEGKLSLEPLYKQFICWNVVSLNTHYLDKMASYSWLDPSLWGNLPICRYMEHGNPKQSLRLLQHPRVNPAAEDNKLLKLAARYGYVDIVDYLMKQYRVDFTDEEYEAFKLAAEHDHVHVLERLVQHSPLISSAVTHEAFRRAIIERRVNATKWLLGYEFSNPSANDNELLYLAFSSLTCGGHRLKLLDCKSFDQAYQIVSDTLENILSECHYEYPSYEIACLFFNDIRVKERLHEMYDFGLREDVFQMVLSS